MVRRANVAFILLCLVALEGGCKPNGSSGDSARPDDAQALQSIGFTASILVSANTASALDGQGNFVTDENTKLLDVFMKAGILAIDSNLNGNPWWSFRRTDEQSATSSGDIVTVPVASRVIANRSEQRTWTEGSVQYFAETISYRIAVNTRFTAGKSVSLGPFSLRLVLYDDPAVGHWNVFQDLQRGTQFDTNDATGIASAVADDNNIGDMVSAAQKGQQKTYNVIELNYKNSGKLARDEKLPDVLTSKQTNLAYYARSEPNPTISIAGATQYCASLNTPGYGPWRVAAVQDILNLTAMATFGVRQGGIKLPDAPDNRLWQNLIQGGNPALITATYEPMSRNTNAVHVYSIMSDGMLGENSVNLFGPDPASAVVAAHDFYGASDYRVLCVANLQH